MIFTDADVYFAHRLERGLFAPQLLVQRSWPHHLATYRDPDPPRRKAEPALARCEHARWLVDCPMRGCSGAQLASPAHPFFFCVDCLHAGSDDEMRWIPVQFPAGKVAIEEELAKRPHPRNANWFPGESLEDLRNERLKAEHVMQGLEIIRALPAADRAALKLPSSIEPALLPSKESDDA